MTFTKEYFEINSIHSKSDPINTGQKSKIGVKKAYKVVNNANKAKITHYSLLTTHYGRITSSGNK